MILLLVGIKTELGAIITWFERMSGLPGQSYSLSDSPCTGFPAEYGPAR
jgi:hypothetical protein